MNQEQIRLFSKMKKLINQKKKRFLVRNDGTDYVADLLELGISEEEAWREILNLNNYFYYPDPKPYYYGSGALTFKKQINGLDTYIKLKIEDNGDGEETVCLSFHRSR
ncbi:MAG: hypothetical protein J6J17_01030 [Bacilli bacterium]|nr:hypothetical protein [Bacilli bacterium]